MLSAKRLSQIAHDRLAASGLGKGGSCHIFRHSMATLMLEHGADVRYIQQLLGHSHLSSTEIYTHVAIRKLKAVHDATHPGAHLRRAPKTGDGSRETAEKTAPDDSDATAHAELLSRLAAEADDESET